MVKQFYRDVAQLPQISDHAISNIMEQLSINDEFDTIAALKELYIYVTKYRDQVSWWNQQINLFAFDFSQLRRKKPIAHQISWFSLNSQMIDNENIVV